MLDPMVSAFLIGIGSGLGGLALLVVGLWVIWGRA